MTNPVIGKVANTLSLSRPAPMSASGQKESSGAAGPIRKRRSIAFLWPDEKIIAGRRCQKGQGGRDSHILYALHSGKLKVALWATLGSGLPARDDAMVRAAPTSACRDRPRELLDRTMSARRFSKSARDCDVSTARNRPSRDSQNTPSLAGAKSRRASFAPRIASRGYRELHRRSSYSRFPVV